MPEAIDVLIVEDDPMVAAIHRQFIGAVSGFIVAGVVSSGKDALEFLQRHPVRLVILDVFLPGMDGVATLQKIREMNRTVGVIVVSASRDTNTINAVLFHHSAALVMCVNALRDDGWGSSLRSID